MLRVTEIDASTGAVVSMVEGTQSNTSYARLYGRLECINNANTQKSKLAFAVSSNLYEFNSSYPANVWISETTLPLTSSGIKFSKYYVTPSSSSFRGDFFLVGISYMDDLDEILYMF